METFKQKQNCIELYKLTPMNASSALNNFLIHSCVPYTLSTSLSDILKQIPDIISSKIS